MMPIDVNRLVAGLKAQRNSAMDEVAVLAARVQALEDENAKLKAQIEQLPKPGRRRAAGGPSQPPT